MYPQSNDQQAQGRYKAKFVGDRELSTYRWELYLKGEKAYTFDGYSKNRGQAEKHDKQALFQDCVSRICSHGYLDKTYQMLWYKRGGPLAHKKEDRLLLEMYPTHCITHNELQLDLQTTSYLQRIYDAKLSGKPFDPKKLLPPRESVRDFEAIDFGFSLMRFPTEDILVEHCKQLIDRYPYSRVEAWWKAVRDVYETAPGLPSKPMIITPAAVNQDQRPAPEHQFQRPAPTGQRPTPNMATPSAMDADNQQTVQNAKNALNGFYGKHSSNR